MFTLATGHVTRVTDWDGDAQELEVALDRATETRRAVNYTAFTDRARVGDKVLLNTTAHTLGLGTGGYDFVTANLELRVPVQDGPPAPGGPPPPPNDGGSRASGDKNGSGTESSTPPTIGERGGPPGAGGASTATTGHIIKARYLPCQHSVLTLEEQPQYADVWERELDSLPVLVGQLHSQIAPAAAGLQMAGKTRVAYVMTDGAALPLPFSRLVGELKSAGLLHTTLTCGQAFGGEHETVTLHSALIAARHILGCDAVIVCQGPGNAGTGTKYGFSGVAQAQHLDVVKALGGTAIAIVRMSGADPRERHQGISHHTRTTLDLTYARCIVALPTGTDVSGLPRGHDMRAIEKTDEPLQLLARKGIALSSMGRTPDDDPLFFRAAAAAGLAVREDHEETTMTDKPLPSKMEEKTTSSKRIYNGKIINLRVDTVVLPNGKPSQREIVEHRGAVAMVPLRADGDVVLVRQWRTPAQSALLEIPAGTLDPGEDPTSAAHRELAEEINLHAGRMTKLFEAYMAPGYTTELIRFFLAQDLTATPGHTDEDEFLEIVELPLEDALGKIGTGEIRDAKSISGLLFVDRMRHAGQLGENSQLGESEKGAG